MTYFGFLLRFLVIPIAVLLVLTYRDRRQGRALPPALGSLSPWAALAVLIVIAVVYTAPWDNYLVATEVWGYDPALVTGITLGWVPLEEYVFFALQPVLAGLWLVFLARRVPLGPVTPRPRLRAVATGATGATWLASAIVLLSGWAPGTYLALQLVWALPPIGLQLAFGADILWSYRRLVVLGIGPATLYLSAMDTLAIHSGTWTINLDRSLGILLGGTLPLEEAVFFLLTNTLLSFGLVLALAREGTRRLPAPVLNRLVKRDREPFPSR
ncbi:MAG TPA: lycopene cyclase domain-containing protein [Aggregatilineaceae bacterium]|nr:lycopene cyclase domain-containing protein [Anaerolineae bacterium]HMM28579.1 lycopene cyclase domain-containing protein [Aggregatilineaceae bacterium]